MSSPPIKRLHFLVHGGTVQGVFFRAHTVASANTHHLTGWVRNLPNGKVEGEAQGPDDALKEFMKDVERGPERAHVVRLDKTEVAVVESELSGVGGFRKVRWGEEAPKPAAAATAGEG
ncbi:Acylphosphatase-domain-containing protein [Geopyxis carbonaria]|nr:Acylphosphatase-domain-containing protein [Geopyxis carbonaria]